jgi:hypothetical protein
MVSEVRLQRVEQPMQLQLQRAAGWAMAAGRDGTDALDGSHLETLADRRPCSCLPYLCPHVEAKQDQHHPTTDNLKPPHSLFPLQHSRSLPSLTCRARRPPPRPAAPSTPQPQPHPKPDCVPPPRLTGATGSSCGTSRA